MIGVQKAISPTMPESITQPDSLYDMLHRRCPRVHLTLLLIAINTVVFGLMLLAGASLGHGHGSVQLDWGANFGPATQDGQWWRLGSALFLHFGIIHLAMNLWALWDGGQLVERIYGHLRFATLYFASGLCGNLLSLVTQGNEAVSGGASGAIFGVYGALLVYLWREREDLHPAEFRWLFLGGLLFTATSIALGLLVPGIDNSAHIGGLLSGALLGILLGRPRRDTGHRRPKSHLISGALLGIAIALLIALIPEASYRWSEEVAAREEIREFLEREAKIQAHWQDITRPQRLDQESIHALAKRIDEEIAAPYEESFERLSELQIDSAIPSAAEVDALRHYSEQRRDISQALASQLRARAQFGPAHLPPSAAPPNP